VSGDGGAGSTNDYRTGSNVTYAGGGGGGTRAGTAGSGGSGGGGDGSVGQGPPVPTSGTANSGGGGGGGGSLIDGGAGGSGIVVIRYISTTEKATGGVITTYVDGSDTYQVHTFLSTSIPHTITANGSLYNTRAVRKVGDSSIHFEGNDEYLSVASSSDFAMGTGAYTFEWWFKFTNTSTALNAGVSTGSWSSGALHLRCEDSYIEWNQNGGSAGIYTWTADTDWNHIAYVREGTGTDEVKTYLNGSNVVTGTDATDYSSSLQCDLGKFPDYAT